MGLLFLAFVVTPFVELYLLIRMGRVIGAGSTLLFVVAMGLLGAALAKSQGAKVLADWQRAMAEGRVPEEGLLGSMLVLVGGILLITPGVITDLLGLSFLIPPVRHAIAGALRRHFAAQVSRGAVQFNMYGFGAPPPPPRAPTEVGRVVYRPGDVIDTDGEEL